MLMAFAAEGSGPICFLAGRTDWSLGFEWLFNAVRLPLNHSDSQWLVDVLAIFVGTIVIQGETDVGSRPRLSCVRITDAAHIPRLVVLLAFLTDS